jgi:hypothetical protein
MRLCRLGSIVLGRQTPFLRHLVSDSDAGQQHLEGECGYRSKRAHNSDAEQPNKHGADCLVPQGANEQSKHGSTGSGATASGKHDFRG